MYDRDFSDRFAGFAVRSALIVVLSITIFAAVIIINGPYHKCSYFDRDTRIGMFATPNGTNRFVDVYERGCKYYSDDNNYHCADEIYRNCKEISWIEYFEHKELGL